MNILNSPILYTIGTLFLWAILYYTLTRLFRLKQKTWKKLEFIWIGIGFFGVISVISENEINYKEYKRENEKAYIQNSLTYITSSLYNSVTCFKFIKASPSPTNFDDIQYDQDRFCIWSKFYKLSLDTLSKIPNKKLDTINKSRLKLKTGTFDQQIVVFNEKVKEINTRVEIYDQLSSDINRNWWKNFQRSLGILLIMIAFAIRLTIAAKNVSDVQK